EAALLLVALIGVAAVPVTYLCGRALGGRRVGMIGAVLVALFPLLAELSGLVRPYSLLPVLCLLSVTLLTRALLTDAWRYWVGWAVATLAFVLTHNWAGLAAIAEGACAVALLAWRPPGVRGTWRRALAAGALLVAGYAPWLPTFLAQAGAVAHPGFGELWPPTVLLSPFFEDQTYASHLLIFAALTVLGTWFAWRRLGPERRTAAAMLVGVPAVATGVAFLFSVRSNVVLLRCLATLVPCVALAAALWLDRVPRRMLAPLLLALVAWPLVEFARRVTSGRPHSNAAAVAGVIEREARPGDLVVVAPMWPASSLNWYSRRRLDQMAFPFRARITAAPFDSIVETLADPAAARAFLAALDTARLGQRRVWLVTEGLGDDPVTDRDVREAARRRDTWLLGRLRARQVQLHLRALYGAASPERFAVPGGSHENLTLERFEAPGLR
ncbi:MAG TPA: glycosyltransferase family 39 protein, partial [Gemmatimonadaceae bacterium]|nr:glycosyltransferase family 39 protein [Gemmatimonadaceae bacterium]